MTEFNSSTATESKGDGSMTAIEGLSGRYVGQSVRRVNDRRLVTGFGQYVDDVHIPGTLHAAFVRSPHAHAVIGDIDASAALDREGVVTVITGRDLPSLMPPIISRPGMPPDRTLERYPITPDKARFAGDAVALVIAEDPYTARDAADQVRVQYQPVDAVVDAIEALEPDAPKLYEDWDSNLGFLWEVEHGDLEGAFKSAPHEVSVELRNQRIHATFIEPRCVLANWEPNTEEMTVWASTQVPHTVRGGIASALELAEYQVRVIAPDVGGAFGAKGGIYPEYILFPAIAKHLGKPVHWAETRSECFVATNHGRDQVQILRAAVNDDGKVEGLEVNIYGNVGAYNAAQVPTRSGVMSTGPYHIRNLHTRVYGVMTNTTPIGAYRGAGRPEAAYMLERLMNEIAQQLDLDPTEVRRRNFVPVDAFPYMGATGAEYDSGDYNKTLDEAIRLIDYEGFRVEQTKAREEGRYLGIGFGVYCEFAGPGWDSAAVRVHPSGSVLVTTGTSPHGQGQETSLAQIAADVLGVDIELIKVKASDTAITPQGVGTFGSRGTSIGGSAVLGAANKVAEKMQRIAAGMLEVAVEDIVQDNDEFSVRGAPDQKVTFKEIARAAYTPGLPDDMELGLEETDFFTPKGRTFPFGVHVAIVEIERESGKLDVKRFLAVDDCGPMINPQLVKDQVIGGLAQGFGQALQEQIVYDESGQLLTGTLMDYGPPRAGQLPNFETAHTVTPSPFNPLGVKGVGEAGTTGAPPALVNAAIDALSPLGVTHLDMPLTAERLWKAMNGRE
jgi:aerobic carbon-monoxide dehydrogenase large subunit